MFEGLFLFEIVGGFFKMFVSFMVGFYFWYNMFCIVVYKVNSIKISLSESLFFFFWCNNYSYLMIFYFWDLFYGIYFSEVGFDVFYYFYF